MWDCIGPMLNVYCLKIFELFSKIGNSEKMKNEVIILNCMYLVYIIVGNIRTSDYYYS